MCACLLASRLPAFAQSFSVNLQRREDSRLFFNAVFGASDLVPIEWTGNLTNCDPGHISKAFQNAVGWRINYFRAMAGVPSNIVLHDAYNPQCQEAAAMLSKSDLLTHYPLTTYPCYTEDAARGTKNSNISIGSYGPEAIRAYMQEYGEDNFDTGHRRLLLLPQTVFMGTGDVPPSSLGDSANATWVMDGNRENERPPTREPFVAWPPPGYVPAALIFPRWSCSYPKGDFSRATVALSRGGVGIPVTIENVTLGFGENAVVWKPNAPLAFDGTDTSYQVKIDNIGLGEGTTNFTYTVIVFDPRMPSADAALPAISNAGPFWLNYRNGIKVQPVPSADRYEFRVSRRVPGAFKEGAEPGPSLFTNITSEGYAYVTNHAVNTGTRAFHLAHLRYANQSLLLKRPIVPGTRASIQFYSRLAKSTSSEIAKVQVSLDEGASWIDAFAQVGGSPTTSGEASFSVKTVNLSKYTGRALLVRFYYALADLEDDSFFDNANAVGVGWYFDDISFDGFEQLTDSVVTQGSVGDFAFQPAVAGTYSLETRGLLLDKFGMEWSPSVVAAVSQVRPTARIEGYSLAGAGPRRIDFFLSAGAATNYKLFSSTIPFGPGTEITEGVTLQNRSGGHFSFLFPASTMRAQYFWIQLMP